jgi:nucleoside phosphorylase
LAQHTGGFGRLRYGDVVVADRICAYEYGQVDNGVFLPRHDLDSPTDAAITSAARTLTARYPDWHADLGQVEGSQPLTPRIVVGQVASGDKVVDDPTADFFASVIASRPMLRAVEMEGASVAAAIQDLRKMQRSVSFGMIRGISDLPPKGGSGPACKADRSKQAETRKEWKARASATAAMAAIQLIRLWCPRPPRHARPSE